MIAQGAKPVGEVYRVFATGRGRSSSSSSSSKSLSRYEEGEEGEDDDDANQASRLTIGAIVLNEAATVEEDEAEGRNDDDTSGNDDDGALESQPKDRVGDGGRCYNEMQPGRTCRGDEYTSFGAMNDATKN